MVGIFSMVGRMVGTGVKLGLGTGIGRMALGAGVGSIYGAATSDANTSTGQFRDIAAGALIGLGIGSATTGTAIKGAFSLGKGAVARPSIGRSPVAHMIRGTAKAGMGVGRFALNNPKAAAMLTVGGLGMYGLSRTGPGSTDLDIDQTAQLAEQMSGTQNISRVMYQNSTEGLVQGLHKGRHK